MGDGAGFERAAGGDFADEGDDFVAGGELFGGGGGLAGLRLVIFVGEFERATEDAAGGVDLLEGEDDAVVGGLAEAGFLAGERGVFADLDGFGGAGERCGDGGGREGHEGEETGG